MPPPPGEIGTDILTPGVGGGVESPKSRRTPAIVLGSSQADRPPIPPSERHVPVMTVVEPKAFLPHETIAGQVPRRIEIERKKRQYASRNIRATLKSMNVLDTLVDMELRIFTGNKLMTPIDDIPLPYFDNVDLDSRPEEMWAGLVMDSLGQGIPARAKDCTIDETSHAVTFDYRTCRVIDYDAANALFTCRFASGDSRELSRIFVCFDAEDPMAYCERLQQALERKEGVMNALALNLYVDCMPVDNLRPLDSEQVSRVLARAMNRDDLRGNGSLDTSSLVQQYNLSHMRTLNQMTLARLMLTHPKELAELGCRTVDPTALTMPSRPAPTTPVAIGSGNYEEMSRNFRFNSMWNKEESIHILLQSQELNLRVHNQSWFVRPEETMKLESFSVAQSGAAIAMQHYVKDTWMQSIVQTVRVNLEGVQKGWFNIEEDNLEVYTFSKLKKFLCRLNFQMQDICRDVMMSTVADYTNMIMNFCPLAVTVESMVKVDVTEAPNFSLFAVELLFMNPTADTPAYFTYSTSAQIIFDALMLPFDNAFDLMKGVVRAERRVMKNLFWSYDPIMRAPYANEDWVVAHRNTLVERLTGIIFAPMEAYLGTLGAYMDLIGIDVVAYAEEAETKFCAGDQLKLDQLYALAAEHVASAENVADGIPNEMSLGLIKVDCVNVKKMLGGKHRQIATKLFEVLEARTRVFSEGVIEEFTDMHHTISVHPNDIEALTELRDYMSTLGQKIAQLDPSLKKNEEHFKLLEQTKKKMPLELMDMRYEIILWPTKMQQEMVRIEKNLRVLEFKFKQAMEEEQEEFAAELNTLTEDVDNLQKLTKLADAEKNATKVRGLKKQLAEASEKASLFTSREGLFNVSEVTEYDRIQSTTKKFEPFFDLWDCAERWIANQEKWTNGAFFDLDSEAVEMAVGSLLRSLTKSAKTFDRLGLSNCNVISVQVREEVALFQPKVPLIVALRNPGMRDRHWDDLQEKAKVTLPEPLDGMTLQGLVDLGLVEKVETVEKVAERAGKEYAIETALDKMQAAWEPVELFVDQYRETGTCILKGVDEYMALLDEHITMTQAMAFSAFKGPFEERIDNWNTSLQMISEVIDEWIALQRNWLYLQPIFDSEDINKQLPQEGKRFSNVDKYWRATMKAAEKGVKAVEFCDDARLLDRFKEGNKLLDLVQKGLADYLETKRAGFSRFYFLSNDELLEILSETKDPLRVQPHLRKCFEGIKGVDFQEDLTITGMTSPERENVTWVAPVDPKGKNIEVWMGEVKDAMVAAVRDNMIHAVSEYGTVPRTQWMQTWAAQCVLNGSQLHWTREVEALLTEKGNDGAFEYYEQLIKQLEDMVILIRGKISKLARTTVGALAVIDVHARDVQKKMAEAGISATTDFDWISQMRYYWQDGDYMESTGDMAVIMVSSKRWYGNEYLGNSFRLVITPLTDKCYLTLMGALQMILGGAPAGPAGTGKTETTKDLAKALAKQCVVFNCSDGLDYLAMGKFFKGLASSGAWACFDEFNRINIEVLSVIAQQVIQLQGTVQRGEKRTVFEGTDILVDPEFAVFITMNPGYAGRAELPDNLTALFRPVAMMVPDYALIAEIMLFSYGYMENRSCAQKMVATFRLCSEQLSSQDHYDYGMRAVKTVITAAGNLKQADPDALELALLMRALQDVNVPKFLSHDLPLFAGILSDLFPGIQRPPFDYGPLITCIKSTIAENNLQPTQGFINKVIELYEMICVRHGLMVVGPTGGGKSSNIRTLQGALTRLKAQGLEGNRYELTKVHHLNPKSIRMGQLYGEFDANTHEWQDGILCVLIRLCIKEDNSNLKWMLFDGPVDALWIENMNTVLDDNKKLCLTSGEIIGLSEPMTMMFEPEDLAVASPATVSRCGMIYMEPHSLGYDVLLMSWLNTVPPALGTTVKARFGELFDCFVPHIIPYMRKYTVEPLPTTNNGLVAALFNLMDTFLVEYIDRDDGTEKKTQAEIDTFCSKIDAIFIFCFTWSFLCTVNIAGRKRLDDFVRKLLVHHQIKNPPPIEGMLYDYKYIVEDDTWCAWKETGEEYVYDPKAEFSELIIPTNDSIGYTHILDILVRNKFHVLMTGPTGTGKTVNISRHLSHGLSEKYVPIMMAFSAQTSANQTQDLIDSKTEKRRKGVYGPSAGKEFIIFVDDVNMPMKETYGAQPPIEILRQWFDAGGWYDRKELVFRKIIDIILVCACGPPGGGRNDVTARFYRHFNIINYTDLSDSSMQLIFQTILGNFLSNFEEDVSHNAHGLVDAALHMYNTIIGALRPTPAKPHYTFNLRDLSKVFQGMLMVDRRKVQTSRAVGRLWWHECSRVFGDRLVNGEDIAWLRNTMATNLEKYTELKEDDLWAEHSHVLYSDFMIPGADPKIYEEVTSLEMLQQTVEEYLQEYNAESKQPMNLVMFTDAVMHVTKITRVFRQPSGHALLLGVGGSGRQSLTRLASYISGYRTYQIEISKGYGMNEFHENLKECLLYAGVDNKPIVFLFNDVQIINEAMLEDINSVLNSGDVPNLYAVEDIETITLACKGDCVKKKIPPTKLNVFSAFLTRVKSNTHVALCMSPLGEAFRNRLRKFPSIVNCCTIDWFMEWPEDALQSVAERFLSAAQLGVSDQVEQSLTAFFQYAHQSIEKLTVEYLNRRRRYFYVTPTSYLELLSTYETLLKQKRKEVGQLRDRLSVGVDKLISTEKSVNELQAQLTEMEPVLIKTQAEVEVMIVQITKDKAAAAETKAIVSVEEAAAAKKAAETKAIADDAQRDLDEALPALDEAVKCLKDLKKADIDEVKSLGKPPANVVKTLTACCIMFKIKPERVADPDQPGKKVNDYFNPSKKVLLANSNKLIEDMQNYDKDHIAPEIISQIEVFYNDPNFTPAIIEKASKACKAMCMWTRAMYKYHQVTLVVEPKKKQLAEAEKSLAETMGILEKAQAQLKAAEDKIKELEDSFNVANAKKEQLVVDVEQCRSRLDRAVTLMSGLGGERTRWTQSCADLTEAYDDLVGDTLVCAGAISYLGVFTPDFRHEASEEWMKKLLELKIPARANCGLRTTMADPVAIRAWTICGLPQDNHSVENGVIMAKGRRYPLLIDPQGQANRYIKNMGKDPSMCVNDLDIIKLSDKNFLRTLENGVRFGRWVLLENIGEELDASLEPLLLQQKFKQGGTEMIRIGDSTIPWNDTFKFYMTTKLPNPHYAPEVCVKVSLLNFAITFTGLEDQLLGAVVVEEMPEMEEKKNSLVISNARMKKELQEIEDQILHMLANSQGNILDDHKLIEALASSKIKSKEIQAKVADAQVVEEQIDVSRNSYRPVAYRGSILYFCIADLGTVDPMYQYSLQWFRNLFIQAIRLSEKSDDHETRLKNLNEFFTYYLYTNICRSLFERHKLLFAFLLTIRILQGNDEINAEEWSFLITGKCLGSETHNNPDPEWLDGRMWSEFCQLSTLPAFAGLAENIIRSNSAWKGIYDAAEPQIASLPGDWNTKLNSLQKLCVLRAIRADRVPDGVLNYVIEKLGQKFVEPPPFNLLSCFKDSNVTTPLVFVLSKGSDPTKALLDFAVKQKMDRKTKMLSLGQGQGPKAAKMFEEGTQKGGWVFLQNCHLYISWLQELERLVENLTPDSVHKDFRLWLTSMPCKEFPVSVLQSSVKMTNEPPKGLKANLRNAYYKLNNDMLNVTSKPDEYKKLLFSLCFFHAVVQERRQFGPLGWNIPYEFNDTDLDISRGQLELFLDAYEEIPWKVLQFLTSFINYGGRVTDYIDIRTTDVIMKSFYNPDILQQNYKFDDEGIFYSFDPDENDPHGSYLEYIEGLPLVASPSVFGMHDNAKIASANTETFTMFDICSSLEASSGGGGGGAAGSRELMIEASAKDILERTQEKGEFDVEAISMMYPVVYEESMNTVLLQECIRYNKLIATILRTLPLVRKALQGLVVMSSELEQVANAIALNAVPDPWAKVAYPSLKPCNAWSDDLMARLGFIHDWIANGVPSVFWISGFYFPQAFLTGSLQNFARKYQYPIDTVSFDFIVNETHYEKLSKPEDGVYVRGLFLEGARWNSVVGSVDDSLPKQLYTELPVLHLFPVKDRKDKDENVYRCPVYKILSRRGVLSTTGHSTNFIMWIELPSRRTDIINNMGQSDQEEWIRAGVAAFSSLMY